MGKFAIYGLLFLNASAKEDIPDFSVNDIIVISDLFISFYRVIILS